MLPASHAGPVHSFRGGGQSKQDLGLKVVQESLIGRRGSMVELINDNEIIVIQIQLLIELLRIHRQHADEQMIQIFRNVVPDKQLSEVQVTKNTLECVSALGQDFFTVSYE